VERLFTTEVFKGGTMKEIGWVNLTETEKEVSKILNERWVVGRKRYGRGITYKSGWNPIKWCQEAIEECADQLQYLVALKMCLEKGKNK
jgi:hypothetical protein